MNMLHSIIREPEAITAIEEALLQSFQTTTVQEITPLTGGLSASGVYQIRINEQYYVLKLDNSTPGSGDGKALSCMEIAATAGIAPPVIYRDTIKGISITRFIASTPLSTAFTSPDLLLHQLALTIRSIHALPLFTKKSSLPKTVEMLIEAFSNSGMLSGPVFEEAFSQFAVIKACYPWQDSDLVSSHNDLNPNNIFWGNDQVWVIDGDAATQNDRYVDLAIAANFYIRDEEQENFFLETYFGGYAADYHRARLFLMRQVCRIVYALLMFRLAEQSKPADSKHDPEMENISLQQVREQLGKGQLKLAGHEGQLLFGKALLNEAVNSMRSLRFASSVEQLLAQ